VWGVKVSVMPRIRHFFAAIGILLCLFHGSDRFTTRAAEPEVQPATYTAPLPATGMQFTQQPARRGDRVVQELGVELDLSTTIMQSGQVANQSTTSLRRQQLRLIEVQEIVDGRVRRVSVAFRKSREKSPENKDSQALVAQPVEGKTYLVTRDGDRLIVTDQEGLIPPQKEFEIVANSMQMLGRPNPLAKFLVGRTVEVGDRLQLPEKIAEQLLGLGDHFGKVKKFELQLQALQTIDDQPCAVFVATIELAGDADSPIHVNVKGQLAIQTATCRTVMALLVGPLNLATTERTALGSYLYTMEGGLRVTVRSQYSSVGQ